MDVSEIPADILRAAENALDKLLCNCRESCGGTEGVRRASIDVIARALLAERERADLWKAQAYQVIGNLLDDSGQFESQEGQRALDYFAYAEEPAEDFLPWPRQ